MKLIMLEKYVIQDDMEHDPTAERNREPTDPGDSDNSMNVDEVEEEEGAEHENFDDDEFVEDDFGPQEFSALNNQLDQLQSALDSLESRNDDIHFKLLDLLRSSREIRQVMSEENSRKREGEAAAGSGKGSSSTAMMSEGEIFGVPFLARNDSTASSSSTTNSSIGKELPKTE